MLCGADNPTDREYKSDGAWHDPEVDDLLLVIFELIFLVLRGFGTS
jgi:hypothetical protein